MPPDHLGKLGVDCDEKHDHHEHYLIHYTKCLEFHKRQDYLDECERDHPERKERIDSEIRRFKFLRKTIHADEDDRQLSINVKKCLEKWREDPTFTSNIGSVREWRRGKGKINEISEPGFDLEDDHGEEKYDPEVDFNAYTISYEDSRPVYDLGDRDSRIQGSFPNHKINMAELLKMDGEFHSPLTVAREGERINYFHLPANNMKWVERAMSRYYGEGDLDIDAIDREESPDKRTKAYMLLRPQFWKGQEYGSRSAIIHARHMRPICEIISTNTQKLDSNPNNIVLFCPYLHWDTDRYRDRISQVIGKEEERERIEKERQISSDLRTRRENRVDLVNSVTNKDGKNMLKLWQKSLSKPDKDHEFSRPIRSVSSTFQPFFKPFPKIKRQFESKLFNRDPETGRILPLRPLGQLLIDVARLYEAMSCFRDKSLIKNYLHADPPLHPRRTLDQAYYCTLKTTKWRDRDQVVYRGTRANPLHLHSINPDTMKWNCPGRQDIFLSEVRRTAADKHGEKPPLTEEEKEEVALGYKCPDCTEHIRKVARLIMVDQLWMWILDEKTLITSFPRRYGVNRKDPSGVHHLVRKHLKNVREDHIRTVFDLALIVLVEVTNIFFDRAKTPDHQPQVIDIFADAIGEITNKQAVAFNHLWVWTSKIVNLASPNPFSDITSFVFPLLNINPEGKLQREIKDIIDELDIMLLINRQQLTVIRKFIKHAEDILDSDGIWRDQKGSMFNTVDGTSTSDSKKAAPSTKTEKGKGSDDPLQNKKKKDYLWFKAQADEVVNDMESHISELEGLRASAVSTSSSLDNLLGLMQQQASALQAWQSARQAEETVKQGRAIVMFTIFTIIFLPLSFMTGIFGMNNTDFAHSDGNTMTFREQLRYMLPISLSIIVVALILAYAARSKPIVAVWWHFSIAWVVIKSGAYNFWLDLTWQRDKWVRETDRWIRDMKKEVLRRRQKRIEVHLWVKPREGGVEESTSEEATASGSEALGRETSTMRGSLLSRMRSTGLSSVLRRGDTAGTGVSSTAGRSAMMDTTTTRNGRAPTAGTGTESTAAASAAAAAAAPGTAGTTVHPTDTDGAYELLQIAGGSDSGDQRHGGPGPRASAISGTTLARHTTNATDPARTSTPNMRGGGGNGWDGLRVWDRSFGDSIV